MDASSASNQAESSRKIKIHNYYYQVQQRDVGTRNNTIIKFTKLPEFDFDSKAVWPLKNTYVLQPRLRRIVTLNDEDPVILTSRTNPFNQKSSPFSGRRILTINESGVDKYEETVICNRRNRSLNIGLKPNLTKSQKEETITSSKNVSRTSLTSKNLNSNTSKSNSFNRRNESQTHAKTKTSSLISRSNIPNRDSKKLQIPESKSRISQEKEKIHKNQNTSLQNKNSSLTKTMHSNINVHEVDLADKRKRNDFIYNSTKRRRFVPVITVPVERNVKPLQGTVDSGTDMEKDLFYREISTGFNQTQATVDAVTETEYEAIQNCSLVQTEKILISNYDSLIIPNVTLMKDKNNESKEEIMQMCSKSLPNLSVPSMEVISHKEDKAYIIGRTTLTYTTEQKINIHMVSNKDEAVSSTSSSPLSYPMNVVSVFKENFLSSKDADKPLVKDDTKTKKDKINAEQVKHRNELQSFNCSHFVNNSKLVKPSQLINKIINSGSLGNNYISEQFQRELKFIDSFFESLQYLESCSMSNKSFPEKSVEHWVSKSGFDIKGPEYDSLFSSFENGVNTNDTETMASKSLCLLNLLIRDEQRRAKNLLFVLKMREDALKDFTKSQILWLENKKKHDNIDIPTLKKKQRGALLKLQHECGEMQRMRKAFLALSEKRKVALMKTKRNIELKLKNNVVVEQILLGKKKLKRNPTCDRSQAPLKCFELSSSGCEDSNTLRAKSLNLELVPVAGVTTQSAEKCIQTGESLLNPSQVDKSINMAADNFVNVDGGYLNILFHNLSLPEMFSGGKSYEVNEEALRGIVNSANTRTTLKESDIVEKFIDQIKNSDADRSTTPSTARSLVEEFDQYYKGLFDDDQSHTDFSEQKDAQESLNTVLEIVDASDERKDDLHLVSSASLVPVVHSNLTTRSSSDPVANDTIVNEVATQSVVESLDDKESLVDTTGPLPVPAGAAAGSDSASALDAPVSVLVKPATTTENSVIWCTGSPPPLATPVQSEAEELRRQQLAIEREIKALEQQQQLLVVREIPDKPPPPYIPPAEPRALIPARSFAPDDTVGQKVENILTGASFPEHPDAFDLFIQDFCQESIDKHKQDKGGKPWDACNLLPQKPPLGTSELVVKTTGALKEVLAGVPPAIVCNMGPRRSDHIDDILFAEWRCCEPQWTAHHVDEALVKNQIFEGIFRYVLDKTVTEYKKIVIEGKISNVEQ